MRIKGAINKEISDYFYDEIKGTDTREPTGHRSISYRVDYTVGETIHTPELKEAIDGLWEACLKVSSLGQRVNRGK